MARRGRRRRRTTRNIFTGLGVTGVAVIGLWWMYTGELPTTGWSPLTQTPAPALTTDRPEDESGVTPHPEIPEKGAGPAKTPSSQTEPTRAKRVESLVAAADQALSRSDLVAARAHFSEAMALGIDDPELSRARGELTRIGSETIFSPRVHEGDPFVVRYIIKPGDTLAKLAKANKVSADLLAEINGIANKDLIRAGQTIKIVKGPFRAIIDRASYSLDVYLGTTFVKHYRVGLGADGSTPAGEWRVKTKLKDPTYYPPRGGRIIHADDPKNPLGERWIGLEGVSGEALGQQRYGIHGTIEPESIGRNSSLGCIRMFNEDAEALYTYLVTRHSTVTVR